MLPNNEVRVPRPRFAQSAPRDITAEFTKAASSEHIAPAALIKYLTIFLCRTKYRAARER